MKVDDADLTSGGPVILARSAGGNLENQKRYCRGKVSARVQLARKPVLDSFCDDLAFRHGLQPSGGQRVGPAWRETRHVRSHPAASSPLTQARTRRGQDRTRTDEAYRKVGNSCAIRIQAARVCRTLLNGCGPETPKGQRQFKENHLQTKTCTGCVKRSGSRWKRFFKAEDRIGRERTQRTQKKPRQIFEIARPVHATNLLLRAFS